MKKRILTTSLLLFLISSAYAQVTNTNTNISGYFTAVINKGEVNLNWKILNPENLYKFVIETKKSGSEEFEKLSEILFANFRKKVNEDSALAYFYFYSHKPEENGVYFYRLSAMDISNKAIFTDELKLGITEVPEFKLFQNNPNPFNPSTIINYEVLIATNVKISVYNLTGKFVDVLVDGFQTPGSYTVEFNTTNYSDISSGIYFYKLETNYTSDIKKMIFTK
ncbi:MAG: hypothetical protein HGGPFJEG_00229 [Ignavibacteria bacterium]|nr:hypothetical protein [Ignavibacteria bacterium]